MSEEQIFCIKCKSFTACKILSQESSVPEKVQLVIDGAAWVRRERLCGKCGARFWTGEIDENLIKELVSEQPKAARSTQRKLSPSLFEDPKTQDINGTALGLVCGLVYASAWWDHPTGEYVRAPRHADNVRNSECGWLVEFGSNSFLAGRAIKRCTQVLEETKSRIQEGEDISGEEIIKLLERPLSASVASSSGSEYQSYPTFIGKLRFGSQAIDTRDAAIYLMKSVGVYELLPFSSRPDDPQESWPSHMWLTKY